MAFRLACEAADLFAAFAPVGGALALTPCAPKRPRPTEIANNLADPVVVPFGLGELSFREIVEVNACSAARESSRPAANASCEIGPECAGEATVSLCAVESLDHQ